MSDLNTPQTDGEGDDPADTAVAGTPDAAAVEGGHVGAEPTATQVRRPWRAVVRTVFQGAIALATLLPFIAAGAYGDGDNVPVAVAQVLAVSAGITRVMALPQVEAFLQRFVPFLAAAPTTKGAA